MSRKTFHRGDAEAAENGMKIKYVNVKNKSTKKDFAFLCDLRVSAVNGFSVLGGVK